jgi:2,4-dienoyl-CoA reductase-like NADH-dependent reductase (Old Yellow Enzyme family)
MPATLFEPVGLKGLALRNRLVRSATAEGLATPEGLPTPGLRDLYLRLAANQVGLIITSGAMIEDWPNLPASLGLLAPLSMARDSYVEPWREITAEVKAQGAAVAMQIGHLGRQDIPALRGSEPIAPSAVSIAASNVTPREMTRDDMADVLEKFAQAARRVQEAGFDAVQVHGAHGNLITNFMSKFANRRADQYGGSLANRARFGVEMARAMRSQVGPEFPLMIKLSFSDFRENGLEPEEAVEMAGLLAEAGIDCIEVSGGTLSETPGRIAVRGIAKQEDEAYFREYSVALKKRVDIPVILVGGLRTPEVMGRQIREGAADLVSMSRPFIREPDLVARWMSGDLSKAKCVSCNLCFENWPFRPYRCYVEQPLAKE